VERSASFFGRDHTELAAAWQPFSFVWISAGLSPEELKRVSGGAIDGATHGLFRVTDGGRVLMSLTAPDGSEQLSDSAVTAPSGAPSH
jgi:hypothetical protein